MIFTVIDPVLFRGVIPPHSQLVIAEKDNIEETAICLYGWDEIGLFESEFHNHVYGFLED